MPNSCRRFSFGSAKRNAVGPSTFLLFVTIEDGLSGWKGTNRNMASDRELLTAGFIF
jgi:hypothetical protein